MLGGMTNIVFDDEGMEGSKSNPIIVYDEPENSEGLIRNDKDETYVPVVINKDINRKTVILPCVHFSTAQSVLGQNKHRVPMLMHPLRG